MKRIASIARAIDAAVWAALLFGLLLGAAIRDDWPAAPSAPARLAVEDPAGGGIEPLPEVIEEFASGELRT